MKRNHQQAKLLRFFEDNPDEELTMADVATKLDCSMHAAYGIVQRLKASALVESQRVIRLTAAGRASVWKDPGESE